MPSLRQTEAATLAQRFSAKLQQPSWFQRCAHDGMHRQHQRTSGGKNLWSLLEPFSRYWYGWLLYRSQILRFFAGTFLKQWNRQGGNPWLTLLARAPHIGVPHFTAPLYLPSSHANLERSGMRVLDRKDTSWDKTRSATKRSFSIKNSAGSEVPVIAAALFFLASAADGAEHFAAFMSCLRAPLNHHSWPGCGPLCESVLWAA